MRNLSKRLEVLEAGSQPFEPRTVHIVGQDSNQTREDAIAAYEAESGKVVDPADMVILLCGKEPDLVGNRA